MPRIIISLSSLLAMYKKYDFNRFQWDTTGRKSFFYVLLANLKAYPSNAADLSSCRLLLTCNNSGSWLFYACDLLIRWYSFEIFLRCCCWHLSIRSWQKTCSSALIHAHPHVHQYCGATPQVQQTRCYPLSFKMTSHVHEKSNMCNKLRGSNNRHAQFKKTPICIL